MRYATYLNVVAKRSFKTSQPQKAAIDTGREFTANGKRVRYIRSVFVPGDSRCMCLFEASSPELVKEVNDAARIPFRQIKEALDLTP